MPSFEDQLEDKTQEELAEYERVLDNFTAAGAMEDGPTKEAILDSVHDDAQALGSVTLMAGARCFQVISLFSRDEYAQGLRYFVPTMELVHTRGDDIPSSIRTPLETLVLAPLDAMTDDPAIPRATIEAYLDQLAAEARTGQGARANLALARAFWHSHTGEQSLFEDWFDRWVTSGSQWWLPEKTTTLVITNAILGAFDPREALDHLERRTPTMVGDTVSQRILLIDLAHWMSICGQPDQAWQRYRQVLAEIDDSDFNDIVDRACLQSLVRAAEAAPTDSTDGAATKAHALIDLGESELETDTADATEDTAALARHHLLRGNLEAGARWRAIAEERAQAYDTRNGTDHWSTLLKTRWFHDL